MSGVEITPVLRAAVDHFKEQGRKEIKVPEWGNIIVYASPLTLKERDNLIGSSGTIGLSVMAEIVLLKAEAADGEKLFNKTHKGHFLNAVDPTVTSRIALQILAGPTVEDAEKN